MLSRPSIIRASFPICAALAALAAFAPSALAAERITLRNGYDMLCNHHREIEGHTRVYLNSGEDSYIEFRTEEIAEVEFAPDPPAPPPTAPKPVLNATPGAAAPRRQETKLSEADLHEMLAQAGHEHNLDVDLLASLIKAESNGNAGAVSSAGAQGLMQLMPGTARDLGVQDSFKPEQNVRGGSAYLDSLLTRYHDNLSMALAAYNAGPAAVDKYHGIPPYRETRAYVARVIHEFNRRVRVREAQPKQAAAQPAPNKF